MPSGFIRSLALLKWAISSANAELDLISKEKAKAIGEVASKIAGGEYSNEFPVDVFQTGSGTSTNMNMNEVIANLSSTDELNIHPNDDVNLGQSSNDVIPSAISVSAALMINDHLLKSLEHLQKVIEDKAESLSLVVKTGRTHLMDAMPLTFGQELNAWASQIKDIKDQLIELLPHIQKLALGGTAVGTGVNAHSEMASRATHILNQKTGMNFAPNSDSFRAMSSQDTSLNLSSKTRTLAVILTKISNDLRWMNSGPLAGLGEIKLPALQPGSSIMPGKVNPVIPESVTMVAAQVMGNDTTIAFAAQSGNFQLNVMLPLIGFNLIQSISLLSNSCIALADKAIKDFSVNDEAIESVLSKNPILATALNSTIGYELGSKIVKKAYQEKRTIIDVAVEMTDLDESELTVLLDPLKLTNNS
jgi:fumarate hydratase class II